MTPGASALRLAAAAALVLALTGCKPAIEAPSAHNVCYHMVVPAKGAPQYTVVAKDVTRIEVCMSYLEAMRENFLRLGGGHETLEGAYNGNFIHARREGVFTSQQYDGNAYIALVRSGDGRLVAPGAATPQS